MNFDEELARTYVQNLRNKLHEVSDELLRSNARVEVLNKVIAQKDEEIGQWQAVAEENRKLADKLEAEKRSVTESNKPARSK